MMSTVSMAAPCGDLPVKGLVHQQPYSAMMLTRSSADRRFRRFRKVEGSSTPYRWNTHSIAGVIAVFAGELIEHKSSNSSSFS
jgi:hypothetical protein